MADPSGTLDDLIRDVTQAFYVRGGRVFAHEAEPGKLDKQTIELKCEAEGDFPGLFGTNIVIGTDKHPRANIVGDDDNEANETQADRPVEEEEGWRLETIPTMVSIYAVDEAWITESAGRNDGEAVRGLLNYHEPVVTNDGMAKNNRPMVTAWVAVGPDTFRLLRDHLLTFKECDFSLGLDLRFPRGIIESRWMGRTVKWDGKGQIPITGMTIVWKREDWSADFRCRKKRSAPATEPVYEPSREQRDILDASARVEAAVSKLLLPLWLIAGAVLAFLIFRR